MARSSSGGDWILPAYVNAPNSRIFVSQSAGSPCRNWANSVSTWVDGCCMVIAPELRPGGKTIQLSINGVNFQIDKTGLRQRVGANGAEPAKRGPGRPPKEPGSLEQAAQALEAAGREHERLAQQREQVKASIRGISHDYHFVDLERGVRRNGQLVASAIQAHIEQVRAIAQ